MYVPLTNTVIFFHLFSELFAPLRLGTILGRWISLVKLGGAIVTWRWHLKRALSPQRLSGAICFISHKCTPEACSSSTTLSILSMLACLPGLPWRTKREALASTIATKTYRPARFQKWARTDIHESMACASQMIVGTCCSFAVRPDWVGV